MTRLLLAKNANVDAVDKHVKAPLHYACERGHIPVIELLLANKANVDIREGDYKHTPLHFACFMENKQVASLLLANKADVNAVDKHFKTPLHYACVMGGARNNTQLVKLLLDKKAKVNLADSFGMTPLQIATKFGYKQIVELLSCQ